MAHARQVAFTKSTCTLWLKYFRFGPLEGLWRRLTRIGMPASPKQ